MPVADPTQVKRIFGQAIELPAAERCAYLDGACGDDPALRGRVDALLAAAGDMDFLRRVTLETPVRADAALAAVAAATDGEGLEAGGLEGGGLEGGGRIGQYKILQLIGEGGFGCVFMAEQERPVRRRVALKIIKLGMDTKAVVARFEQERQALALMDHPHIARVLDAGETELGRPYFVMELVKGEPITQFCDKNSLTINERLGLFIQVCQAVQHAHTKGIIHRDLKPSNVLVCIQDGGPVARVIDFGVAKATDHRLTEKTVFTELRQLVGTPEYMSPEQAEGSLDIDTRSDLYSLGVLLYELLTGVTPFDRERLRSAAFAELVRIIREDEPPRPSTRVSTITDTLETVAAHRRVEPRKLGSILRGELDWIVMRAMEKDRARRYESASALAADVQRYLAGEPIEARRDSGWYLLGKLVRRNRVPAAVAAGFVVLVTGAAVTSGILYKRAADALTLAGQRQRQAETQAAKAYRVQQFLEGMLQATDPWPGGSEASLRSMVATARSSLATELAEEPEVRAALQETIGLVYLHLGQTDRAAEELESALATRERCFGRRHPQTASSLVALATLRFDQRRQAEARALAQEALEVYESQAVNPSEVARCLQTLALIDRTAGDFAAAERLQRRALEVLGASNPESSFQMINARVHLADTLLGSGRDEEGIALYSRAIRECRALAKGEDPYLATMLNDLGLYYNARRRFEEAEPLLRESLEMYRSIYKGPDLRAAKTMNLLGSLLLNTERYAEAEPLLRESLQAYRALLGEKADAAEPVLFNLGMAAKNLGRLDDAEKLYEECLAFARPLGHDGTVARCLNNLAALSKARGNLKTSEDYDRQALALRRRLYGDDHIDVAQSLVNLAHTLRTTHQNGAEELYREALAIQRRHLSKDDPLLAISLKGLGMSIYDRDQDDPEAEALLTEAVDILARKRSPEHPELVGARFFLAHSLIARHRYEEAQAQLTECQRCIDTGAKTGVEPARIARMFIHVYELWDKPDLRDQWRRRLEAMPGRGERLS